MGWMNGTRCRERLHVEMVHIFIFFTYVLLLCRARLRKQTRARILHISCVDVVLTHPHISNSSSSRLPIHSYPSMTGISPLTTTPILSLSSSLYNRSNSIAITLKYNQSAMVGFVVALMLSKYYTCLVTHKPLCKSAEPLWKCGFS